MLDRFTPRILPTGLYDETHFGRQFAALPKDVGEKDGSVMLEEAYPSLTRRFYGAAPATRGEYGNPFGMDHEAVVGDHSESFGETESFSAMPVSQVVFFAFK